MLLAQVGSAGGAFVTNVIIARSIGPSPRGEIAFLLQIAYFGIAFSGFGRPQALLVTSRRSEDAAPLALRLLPLPVLSATTIAVAICFIDPIPSTVQWIILVGVFGQLVGGVLSNTTRSYSIISSRPGLFLALVAGNQSLMIGIGLIIASSSAQPVSHWILLYCLASLAPALIAISYINRLNSRRPRIPESSNVLRNSVKRTKKYGYHLMTASTLEQVAFRTDRFLLPILSTFTQLGIFAVASTLIETALWPVRHFIDSRVNEWSRLHERDELRIVRSILPIAAYLAVFSGAMTILSAALLVPIFGSSYRAGVGLAIPLGVGLFFRGLCMFIVSLAAASNQPHVGSIVNIVALMASVTVSLLIVPTQGAMGAAIAGLSGGLLGASSGGFIWWQIARRRRSIA